MRLFVAVAVPAAERTRILDATSPLRAAGLPVRWIEPDAFHLTLQFLGGVSEAVAESVRAALTDVASGHDPFQLRLSGAGEFPGVLWIGVARSAALHALHLAVERALVPLGFPAEARPFAPHLTIGRARRAAGRSALHGAAASLAALTYDAEITIESVDLMQSHLSPRGARYERLLAARLGA